MRKLALLLPVLACASQKSADKPAPDTRKGVELSDIDRSAAPCDDFFQYANGAWRKANPIPSSMQRWGRRWSGHARSRLLLQARAALRRGAREVPRARGKDVRTGRPARERGRGLRAREAAGGRLAGQRGAAQPAEHRSHRGIRRASEDD